MRSIELLASLLFMYLHVLHRAPLSLNRRTPEDVWRSEIGFLFFLGNSTSCHLGMETMSRNFCAYWQPCAPGSGRVNPYSCTMNTMSVLSGIAPSIPVRPMIDCVGVFGCCFERAFCHCHAKRRVARFVKCCYWWKAGGSDPAIL
jgi:hypothetical protein